MAIENIGRATIQKDRNNGRKVCERQTDRKTEIKTGRQTERQAVRQTDRQTDKEKKKEGERTGTYSPARLLLVLVFGAMFKNARKLEVVEVAVGVDGGTSE